MVVTKFIGTIVAILITLLPGGAAANEDKNLPDKLVVGTLDAPPFAMKSADGRHWGTTERFGASVFAKPQHPTPGYYKLAS